MAGHVEAREREGGGGTWRGVPVEIVTPSRPAPDQSWSARATVGGFELETIGTVLAPKLASRMWEGGVLEIRDVVDIGETTLREPIHLARVLCAWHSSPVKEADHLIGAIDADWVEDQQAGPKPALDGSVAWPEGLMRGIKAADRIGGGPAGVGGALQATVEGRRAARLDLRTKPPGLGAVCPFRACPFRACGTAAQAQSPSAGVAGRQAMRRPARQAQRGTGSASDAGISTLPAATRLDSMGVHQRRSVAGVARYSTGGIDAGGGRPGAVPSGLSRTRHRRIGQPVRERSRTGDRRAGGPAHRSPDASRRQNLVRGRMGCARG